MPAAYQTNQPRGKPGILWPGRAMGGETQAYLLQPHPPDHVGQNCQIARQPEIRTFRLDLSDFIRAIRPSVVECRDQKPLSLSFRPHFSDLRLPIFASIPVHSRFKKNTCKSQYNVGL